MSKEFIEAGEKVVAATNGVLETLRTAYSVLEASRETVAKRESACNIKETELIDRELKVARREEAIMDVRKKLAEVKAAKLAAEEREAALAIKLKEARVELGNAKTAKAMIEAALAAMAAEKKAAVPEVVASV